MVKYRQFCANDPFSNSGLDVKSLFQESVGFGNDEILALLYNLIGPEVSKPKSTAHILEQKISYTQWYGLNFWGRDFLRKMRRKMPHSESFSTYLARTILIIM